MFSVPHPSKWGTALDRLFWLLLHAALMARESWHPWLCVPAMSAPQSCTHTHIHLLPFAGMLDAVRSFWMEILTVSTARDYLGPRSDTSHHTTTPWMKTLDCIFPYFISTAAKYIRLKMLTLAYWTPYSWKKQKFRVLLKRFCSIMYLNKCMQLRNADTHLDRVFWHSITKERVFKKLHWITCCSQGKIHQDKLTGKIL